MILKTALTITFSLLVAFGFGQTPPPKYYELADKADVALKAKKYPKAAKLYSDAFKSNGGKGTFEDRYNAACCWSMSGEADSAIGQLNKISQVARWSSKVYGPVLADPDFKPLHKDPRWNPLLETLRQNKEKAEIKLNRPLAAKLDSIYGEDQNLRIQEEEVERKYGSGSPEVKAQWKIINQKDSSNLVAVAAILDQYGWLGQDLVGEKGNATLFLVIQHADRAAQEKYLPMMREAVKQGKAAGSDLALLEDRVAFRQGKKQIYGSQVGALPKSTELFILPLEDPDHVDERRATVGLEPLAGYVRSFGLKWDAEKYKKDLPKLEQKLKENAEKSKKK